MPTPMGMVDHKHFYYEIKVTIIGLTNVTYDKGVILFQKKNKKGNENLVWAIKCIRAPLCTSVSASAHCYVERLFSKTCNNRYVELHVITCLRGLL